MPIARIMTVAAAAALAAGTACNDAAGPGGVAVYLRFGTAEPHVQAGSTLQLTATALDVRENPVTGVEIAYRAEAPEIATVDAAGRVTGVSPGQTAISAWAGKAHGLVPLVVEPRGGLQVARFALLPGDSVNRSITVDTWALAPQDLRFTARNAAGVNLCPYLPLQLSVRDPEMLTARHQPGGDGCAIRLEAPDRASATAGTVLYAGMGGVADSVKVFVNRARYRVALSIEPSFVSTIPAGARVRYELSFVSPDGSSVEGIPVGFEFDTVGPLWCCLSQTQIRGSVTTDASGLASFTVRAPRSTVVEYWGYPTPQHWPALYGGVLYLDRTTPTVWQSIGMLTVVAGEPVRIGVFRQTGYGLQSSTSSYTWSEVMEGDTIVVPFYPGNATPEEMPYFCPRFGYTVGAALLDGEGNASGVVPRVASGADRLRTQEARFSISGVFYHWWEYHGGKRLEVTFLARDTAGLVTFSYPGLPSRSVYVVKRSPPSSWCGG
ncbi:MAG TPA: Ig-like domain-containing protein [Longimicrobium sp.]|nr:Ig-like domain-containing protein [Longimicrobium sp.]